VSSELPSVETFEAKLGEVIDEIGELVACESPTNDLAACARSAQLVAAVGQRHLGQPAEHLVADGVPHLRWRLGDPDADRRVLLVGHHDTVWPLGSLARLPWSVTASDDGPVLRGPGCFDMKTGLIQMFHAVEALALRDGMPPVTILVTGDEEVGSISSRPLIEAEARQATAALVLEASDDGAAIKIARKGVSLYTVNVTGRAAHAGLHPERGVNAGLELAAQVQAIARIGSAEAGTTVTPTALSAGTTSNTVPAEGRVQVDVRAWTMDELSRVDRAMHALSPSLPHAHVSVEGSPNRPPMEATSSSALAQRAVDINVRLGLGALPLAAVGGASDGNFTAGVGCPTLDGLGAVGGGAHADDEHVLARYLPQRTALLAALIHEVAA
jgi:glutamate carboxypeptidase